MTSAMPVLVVFALVSRTACAPKVNDQADEQALMQIERDGRWQAVATYSAKLQ